MTGPSAFAYQHGRTWLHRSDVRCKLVALCGISISTLYSSLLSSAAAVGVLLVLCLYTGLPLVKAIREIRVFVFLILAVILTRAAALDGDLLWSVGGITFTRQGLTSGLTLAQRFGLVLAAGLLFSSTTRPAQIKSAVQWLLKPVPLIPEKKVGIMISLAFAFLPLLITRSGQIRDAQNARCADLQRNPFRRIIRLSIPLLHKAFQSADQIALAMEARVFSEDRTDPEFLSSGREVPILFSACAFSLFLILF